MKIKPMPKLIGIVVVIVLGAGGCGRLKPQPLLNPQTRVASRNAVIFFADGVNREVYRRMLAAGELPEIEKYLVRRGASVENAVTVAPSITYAVTTSLITGLVPGHHGILSNRFFDRDRLFFADYTVIKTYRDTERNFSAPTIYEMLPDKYSVTIQSPIRRGAYRQIDNWASSGIRWYFHQIIEIDALTAERFYLIGQEARIAGRWPELIFAYFPAADEMGHRYGPESAKYRAAMKNLDEQIGRICRTLEVNGLLDTTLLAFISDHGMASCPQDRYIPIEAVLARNFKLKMAEKGPNDWVNFDKRAEYFREYNAILVNGGYRHAALHLRNGEDWSTLATPEQVQPIARYLAGAEAVALVAWREKGGVMIQNRLGRALLERRQAAAGTGLDDKQYRYTVIDGTDPLGYAQTPAGRLREGYHSGREWLAATAGLEYPDAVVALSEMFDARRTGDLEIFAADGWDFSKENIGGHGSVVRTDMQVPMVFAGPGIPPGGTLPNARVVDLAPTIMEWLGTPAKDLDGRSLLKDLPHAETAEAAEKQRSGIAVNETGITSKINEISGVILDTAIQVHKQLGPGLLESVYQAILAHELRKRKLKIETEVSIPVFWDGIKMEVGYRADLIVENLVIVELKSRV